MFLEEEEERHSYPEPLVHATATEAGAALVESLVRWRFQKAHPGHLFYLLKSTLFLVFTHTYQLWSSDLGYEVFYVLYKICTHLSRVVGNFWCCQRDSGIVVFCDHALLSVVFSKEVRSLGTSNFPH